MSRTPPRAAMTGALALLLAACTSGMDAGATDRSATPRVVELSMEGMRFVPERVEVRLHETVRFLVRNLDDMPHEAFLGTDAEQREHRAAHASAPPGSQADVAHFGDGVYVHARGTEQFVYRFDQPGPVPVGCHLPGHWEGGMRAEITVAPRSTRLPYRSGDQKGVLPEHPEPLPVIAAIEYRSPVPPHVLLTRRCRRGVQRMERRTGGGGNRAMGRWVG